MKSLLKNSKFDELQKIEKEQHKSFLEIYQELNTKFSCKLVPKHIIGTPI